MLNILPQQFYESPAYHKIMVDGLSSVVYKRIKETVWHKEGYVSTHAITLVLKGKLVIESEKHDIVEVRRNNMVFLPKGIYTISDIMPTDGAFEAMVFFFDEDLIREFVHTRSGKKNKAKCISHVILPYGPQERMFVESLRQLYGNTPAPREITRIKLMEFLYILAASEERGECFVDALSTLNNKEKRSLHAFMSENCFKPLNIKDYAYLSGRSPSKFYRDFKMIYGISAKSWLIEKRMEKAYELLSLEFDKNISEISYEVGYTDIPHFIKQFKKRYGVTPKQLLIQKRKEVLI